MNSNLEDFHGNSIDLLKEPGGDEQTTFSEERSEVMKVFRFSSVILRLCNLSLFIFKKKNRLCLTHQIVSKYKLSVSFLIPTMLATVTWAFSLRFLCVSSLLNPTVISIS